MVPEDVPLPVLRGQLESVASDGGRFSFLAEFLVPETDADRNFALLSQV
jgi:hypothetical protein